MIIPVLYFVLTFVTVAVLAWSGLSLLRNPEDPLADRLEELQAFCREARIDAVQFFVNILPGKDGLVHVSQMAPDFGNMNQAIFTGQNVKMAWFMFPKWLPILSRIRINLLPKASRSKFGLPKLIPRGGLT